VEVAVLLWASRFLGSPFRVLVVVFFRVLARVLVSCSGGLDQDLDVFSSIVNTVADDGLALCDE
jgi:hypothetical protein